MKTFKIEIQETLSKIVEVEADNIEEALKIIKTKYKKEEIVLDSSSYADTVFIELGN